MGNYKFRFSDMMPNAWFYKLKDMTKATKPHHISHPIKRTPHPTTPNTFPPLHEPTHQTYIPNRASYYYTRNTETDKFSISPSHSKASDTHFPITPPRKSSRKHPRKPRRPSTKIVTTRRSFPVSESDSTPDSSTTESPLPCTCRIRASSDIIIDMGGKNLKEFHLPPIMTKPVKKFTKAAMDEKAKRSPAGHHRLRMRASSPRVSCKKIQLNSARRSFGSSMTMQQRMGLSRSFAVVKSSSDPQRDFRDSMVEMIVENNIRTSKDLEELLACYLTLNSNEYHDVIVNVFEQIWFELTDIVRL